MGLNIAGVIKRRLKTIPWSAVREWLLVIATIVLAMGLVFSAQELQSINQNELVNLRRTTYDILTDTRVVSAIRSIDSITLVEIEAFDQLDESRRAVIEESLRQLDSVAAMIILGVVDENLAFDILGTNVANSWVVARSFAETNQENKNIRYNPKYLIQLVNKWKEESRPLPPSFLLLPNIDLLITRMNFSPSIRTVGETISTTFTVKNQGSSPSGYFYVRIFLATSPWGADIPLGEVGINSLEGSASQTISVDNDIPNTVEPEKYWVTAYADALSTIEEVNEFNNIYSSDVNKIIISLGKRDLTVMPSGGGIVDVNPSEGSYYDGAQVTLTATPSTGWRFSSWIGDISGTENPLILTMDSNKNIITNFVEAYTLQAAARPANAGDVVLSPGGGTYPSDTRVTLTVSLAANYRFASWSGDIGGTNPVMIIIMDSNKSVTAHLVPEGW